ncbi:unnamed protein product [Closterium sp. NIES-65]|nr:unnamed protein product [Closterium sp. NIES-65]
MGGTTWECGRGNAEAIMWKGECGSYHAEGGMRKLSCGRGNAEAIMRKGECGSYHAEGGMRKLSWGRGNAEAIMRKGECGSYHVEGGMRKLSCGRGNAEAIMWKGECGSYHAEGGMRKLSCGRGNAEAIMRKGECGRGNAKRGRRKGGCGRGKAERGGRMGGGGRGKADGAMRKGECGKGYAEGGMRKGDCGRPQADGGRRKGEGGRGKAEWGRRNGERRRGKAEGGTRKGERGRGGAEGGTLKGERGGGNEEGGTRKGEHLAMLERAALDRAECWGACEARGLLFSLLLVLPPPSPSDRQPPNFGSMPVLTELDPLAYRLNISVRGAPPFLCWAFLRPSPRAAGSHTSQSLLQSAFPLLSLHNTDDEMTLVDADLQLDTEGLQLNDLPDGTLPSAPANDDAPAHKKLCTEGATSACAHGPPSSALYAPISRATAHHASTTPPAPISAAAPLPRGPPFTPAQAAPAATPAASSSTAESSRPLAPAAASGDLGDQMDHDDTPAIPRSLRRQRAAMVTRVMPRRSLSVVEVLFPEAGAEAIRADLITRILKHLQPFHFRSNDIPKFQPSSGDVLRIPRCAYARLCFSWTSQDDADDFKELFPLTLHLPNARSVLLKAFVDPYPLFTSAKAGGAATLTLRNVPPGYSPEDLRTYLMHHDINGEPAWLADLIFFHQVKDTYEDMFLPIFTGIPVPLEDDPGYLRLPASIAFEDDAPEVLLNISLHACSICGNNHRVADHALFPTSSALFALHLAAHMLLHLSYNHLPTPLPAPVLPVFTSLCSAALPAPGTSMSLPPLLQVWGGAAKPMVPPTPPPRPHPPCFPYLLLHPALGTCAALTAFRNDPGLLFISLDSYIEPWTCALCDLTCGAALDSALAHISSEQRSSMKRMAARTCAAKETYTG